MENSRHGGLQMAVFSAPVLGNHHFRRVLT